MNAKDFQAAAPGRLTKNLNGRLTFVPDALPPKQWSMPLRLLPLLSRIDNLLGRLDGTARALPDQRILIRSFVRREAQLSSYIENTYARYEDVAAAQGTERGAPLSEPVRETLNAERAIDAGVEAVFVRGRPITLSLIRQMHGVLLDGTRGHAARGRFRDRQVYIGKEFEDERFARFVPPPHGLILDLMQHFENSLSGLVDLPPLVQIALLHYQFETIHPFEDGNGRLGRILILLGLCQHRLLTVPLLNASLHFERNRQEYYDRLLSVSTSGDWDGWVGFFLEGLRVATEESLSKIVELTQLRQRYHDKLRSGRNSMNLFTLVDSLFALPRITTADAAEAMGVTSQAARQSVQRLVKLRILKPLLAAYPARFVAEEILRAVSAEPTQR